jgi:hypothetical protein
MRKELVATLKILVPHLDVKPVDRNAQDDQFRHAAKERVGHARDLLFEGAMHEPNLRQSQPSRR